MVVQPSLFTHNSQCRHNTQLIFGLIQTTTRTIEVPKYILQLNITSFAPPIFEFSHSAWNAHCNKNTNMCEWTMLFIEHIYISHMHNTHKTNKDFTCRRPIERSCVSIETKRVCGAGTLNTGRIYGEGGKHNR